ncbi:MAG: DedA family protein [Acidobacteriota bacterium]|nr:DedA family protein [Acidobacteriota bacterium]
MKLAAQTHRFLASAVPPVRPPRHASKLLRFLLGFGVFGIFLVALVDASVVPLPIPGVTDIMLILMAAQRQNPVLLVLLATAGSALGGYSCYRVGRSGGTAILARKAPQGLYTLVTEWVERHAILAVAIPAILPPPVPLTLFVLAAGALRMSRKTFLVTFTISRAVRHTLAVWLGIHYGRRILRLWSHFSARWSGTIQTVMWTVVAASVAYGMWRLYRAARRGAQHAEAAQQQSVTLPLA